MKSRVKRRDGKMKSIGSRVIRAATVSLFAGALIVGLGFGPQNASADYASYISSSGPVGWWGMNETGSPTTTPDLSGAYGAANNQAGVNLPMTYQGLGAGTLTDQAGFVAGAGNRAAYFSGATDSGAFAHGAVAYDLNVTNAIYRYEPNGFAAEAWIKADGYLAIDSERVLAGREWGFGRFCVGLRWERAYFVLGQLYRLLLCEQQVRFVGDH